MSIRFLLEAFENYVEAKIEQREVKNTNGDQVKASELAQIAKEQLRKELERQLK